MNIEEEKFAKLRYRLLKRKYQVARNQARFRDQEWKISFDEFVELWEVEPHRWLDSGCSSKDLNFSRIDMERGWTLDNVHIISRKDMLVAEGRCVRLRNRKKRKRTNV